MDEVRCSYALASPAWFRVKPGDPVRWPVGRPWGGAEWSLLNPLLDPHPSLVTCLPVDVPRREIPRVHDGDVYVQVHRVVLAGPSEAEREGFRGGGGEPGAPSKAWSHEPSDGIDLVLHWLGFCKGASGMLRIRRYRGIDRCGSEPLPEAVDFPSGTDAFWLTLGARSQRVAATRGDVARAALRGRGGPPELWRSLAMEAVKAWWEGSYRVAMVTVCVALETAAHSVVSPAQAETLRPLLDRLVGLHPRLAVDLSPRTVAGLANARNGLVHEGNPRGFSMDRDGAWEMLEVVWTVFRACRMDPPPLVPGGHALHVQSPSREWLAATGWLPLPAG